MMNYIFTIISILCVLNGFAQTPCDGTNAFEEENGLLVIEFESMPLYSNWKLDSTKFGAARNKYIYWDGAQSFGQLSNKQLTYKIKINNPGTYKFTWRMAVGFGTQLSEHNDAWLKITGDDFYALKSGSSTPVKPKPQCQTDPNANCPNGSSTQGYFKVWGQNFSWAWASFTSDNDPHIIYAKFDNPGEYQIIVDARSSWYLLDRMVLRRTDVSDNDAFNFNNPESPCALSTSTEDVKIDNQVKIFPNPTNGKLTIEGLPNEAGTMIITNLQGIVLKEFITSETTEIIDTTDLESGMYLLRFVNDNASVTRAFLKN